MASKQPTTGVTDGLRVHIPLEYWFMKNAKLVLVLPPVNGYDAYYVIDDDWQTDFNKNPNPSRPWLCGSTDSPVDDAQKKVAERYAIMQSIILGDMGPPETLTSELLELTNEFDVTGLNDAENRRIRRVLGVSEYVPWWTWSWADPIRAAATLNAAIKEAGKKTIVLENVTIDSTVV